MGFSADAQASPAERSGDPGSSRGLKRAACLMMTAIVLGQCNSAAAAEPLCEVLKAATQAPSRAPEGRADMPSWARGLRVKRTHALQQSSRLYKQLPRAGFDPAPTP
jgi:hypothetical protein